MQFFTSTMLMVSAILMMAISTPAQTLTQFGPDGFVRIEEGSGGFFADLDAGDRFSRDHDVIGDVNDDGILDIIIGARSDDDGQTDAGAAYIVFMNNDGTVQSNQKISMLEGGFNETLLENNFFGYGVAGIGDYDDDGIPDVAISAPSSTNNAIYIIHLNSNGTVKNFVKNSNIIAQGLSAIGDLNNDGRIDLVACDPNSDLGGNNRGAINILFLDNNSQVMTDSTVTISSTTGGFGVGLENNDRFGGREVAMLGDIDDDGNEEMAVGAFMSDGGKGAVWILSLDPNNYNVVSKLKITEGLNGFNDILETDVNPNGSSGAQFGHAMCAPGDLNGDGIADLITGANQQGQGDAYILYLKSDKTVKTYTKIDELEGGFNLNFDVNAEERFSRSISFIGDLRGDGSIAVNAGGGVGQAGTGTLYLLFFKPCAFDQEAGLNHWSGGNTLFTNWSHNDQMLTSDSLTFEQCTFKAFETDAPHVTYNFNDGRCICKDSSATLAISTELSTAFTNQCSGFLSSLPVELVDFYGQKILTQIELAWTTGSELNNSGFEIQKSTDGQNWQAIDFVEGWGTTNTIQKYQYLDSNPFPGINYYRLKQIDFNGAVQYSEVAAIEFNSLGREVLIYPNPSIKLVNIQIENPSNQEVRVKITDNLGSKIWETEVEENESTWNKEVEFESNGIYFISTQVGDDITYERVVITD